MLQPKVHFVVVKNIAFWHCCWWMMMRLVVGLETARTVSYSWSSSGNWETYPLGTGIITANSVINSYNFDHFNCNFICQGCLVDELSLHRWCAVVLRRMCDTIICVHTAIILTRCYWLFYWLLEFLNLFYYKPFRLCSINIVCDTAEV